MKRRKIKIKRWKTGKVILRKYKSMGRRIVSSLEDLLKGGSSDGGAYGC